MADHFSGPRALADPASDITDVFAFPSPVYWLGSHPHRLTCVFTRPGSPDQPNYAERGVEVLLPHCRSEGARPLRRPRFAVAAFPRHITPPAT